MQTRVSRFLQCITDQTRVVVLTAMFAAAVSLSAIRSAHGGVPVEESLTQLIQHGRLAGSGCKIGVIIIDAETGTVLGEHRADESFIPASNMKLLTSGAALSVLSPEFEFRTKIGHTPENGGQVFVIGSGDPSFGDGELLSDAEVDVDAFLKSLVEHLKSASIAAPSELVIDDRIFDREFVHPTWPTGQLNRWYCAEVSGLTFHTNVLTVYTNPAEPGRPPRLRIEPSASWVSVSNKARSVTKGQQTAWASRDNGSNNITVHGDVRWATSPIEVTLHDNAAFFGRLFADRMTSIGIAPKTVRLANENEEIPQLRIVHEVRTPLSTILQRCNEDSHNLYAECLLKRMGHQVTGAPGSWKLGAAVVRMVLLDRVGANAGQAVVVADGSGMSRENRVTPRMLGEWLVSFHKDSALSKPYIDSLPIASANGTLKKRFRGRTLNHEVRAKSGYLTGVSALSGYITDLDSGRRVAFSIITNEKPNKIPLAWVREFEEKVVEMADEWLAENVPETASVGP